MNRQYKCSVEVKSLAQALAEPSPEKKRTKILDLKAGLDPPAVLFGFGKGKVGALVPDVDASRSAR